jgi:HupE / UreJ protein
LLVAGTLRAHELAIDEVRWWIPPDRLQLRGQLTFDPELTRKLDEPVSDTVARQRILAFVKQQLDVEIDGRRCDLEAEVRELYEVGGATPGDVVMLSCGLSQAPGTVSVGVGNGFPELVVQVAGLEQQPNSATVVRGGERSAPFTRQNPSAPHVPGTAPSALALAMAFLRTGFTHVLPLGFDHLLFVIALSLGAYPNVLRLMWLLGTFTFAHTVTIALAAAGVLAPAPHVIEPLITASIAVAGFAGTRHSRGKVAYPVVLVFGLIHGLGFASGLTSLELPLPQFVVAILAFNFGVELAQSAIAALLTGGLLMLARKEYALSRPLYWASLALGGIGVLWTLQRLLS